MLAATTGELRLVIPEWGCFLLIGMGLVFLVFGTWWPRLFTVFSITVMGCLAGLVAAPYVPLSQPIVIVAAGLLVGGLAAFFREMAHAVLSAVLLALVLATLAAMAVGPGGFTTYLLAGASDTGYSTQINGPNLACDPVLAAALTGLLTGATVAIGWLKFSQRLITSVQGAALMMVGAADLVNAYREGRPTLAVAFPLTLAACWLCLVAIGLVVQQAIARRDETWEKPE